MKHFNCAILNGAIVLLGLLFRKGDFTLTSGITVMAGMDTDCTGAIVGSIMDCALGAGEIPDHYTAPFNDTIWFQTKDRPILKISELADRMFVVALKNLRRQEDYNEQ